MMILLSCLALAELAFAAPIEVPRSEIDTFRFFNERQQQTLLEKNLLNESAAELSVSSWAPRSLTTESWFGDLTFRRTSTPSIAVSYFFLAGSLRRFPIYFRTGVGFLSMNRQRGSLEQSLYLVPIRIGAEVHPLALHWRSVSPYLGVAAVPTWLLRPRSSLADGKVSLATAAELKIGTLVGVFGQQLNLSVAVTKSLLTKTKLDGVGLEAGYRFPL